MESPTQADATFEPPRRLPISAGILSIVLFVIYLVASLSNITLIVAGAAGIVAIITGALALRTGKHRGVYITAIILGALGFLLCAGLWLWAMIFIGAIG